MLKLFCTPPLFLAADCFMYRNKIGLDIAIEAMRDCLAQKKCSVDEIWKYAKVCRVANVIRPYLEALALACWFDPILCTKFTLDAESSCQNARSRYNKVLKVNYSASPN